jgi:glycerol-3-phosphate dehydrogenase
MTRTRSAFDRSTALARMAEETFDVVVIGGGITGAGVALDAASRGLSVALVDKGDFASGTSSRSSKLVHGGLRYLQQKEYRLVYENLAERQLLLENAPHLVEPLGFLIPIFGRGGVLKKGLAKAYRTALWLYDVTGGLRIGRRHKRLSHDEVEHAFPALNPELLVAGFLYWDAHADDARLTLAVLRTAVLDHGAVAANHAPVVAVEHDDDGRASGVRLADGTVVRARSVVNATGVWSDDVRELDEGRHPRSIRPAKGVHLTVPRHRLPCEMAAVVPVPADRRSIFVVPWGDHVYLGTTDTDYDGPVDDPRCTAEDVAYILGAINLFIRQPISESDITGTWAGLRPLVKDASSERTSDLSRRHKVQASASGMVSISGGKLTTYRRMAADTVDALAPALRRRLRRSTTRHLSLRGAEGHDRVESDADDALVEHLRSRYGSEARVVLAMVEADPELGRPLVPGLPYVRAEAVFAARYEMAQSLDDVLSRRTRALLLDAAACRSAAPSVARLLAPELGWDSARVEAEVRQLDEQARVQQSAAGLLP